MESIPQIRPDLKRHIVDGLAAFLNGDMPLAALTRAGRKEKRKVVTLYGMPQAQHIEEWSKRDEDKMGRVGVRAAGRSGDVVLDGQGDRVAGRVDEESAW